MNETPPFEVRPALCDDARAVSALVRANADRLIVRSLANISERIDRFLVAVSPEGKVIGTTCFELFPELGDPMRTWAELQSVCTAPEWRGRGVGTALVEAQMERLREIHVWQAVVLTYEVHWFERLGFHAVDKRTIMQKLYWGCVNCSKHESPFSCPESAMVAAL